MTASSVENPSTSIANLGGASLYWSQMRPQATALASEGASVDWAQLETACNALAATLADLGVGPGDRVGLLLGNCLEWPVCFLAILRLGAVAVTLNPRLGAYELQQIERDADCCLLIWKPELCPALKAAYFSGTLADTVLMISGRRQDAPTSYVDALSGRRFVEPASVGPDSLLGICYTSGTTGLPKGVMLTHGSVHASIFGLACALRLTSDDCGLLLAPLAYAGPLLLNMCPHLLLGGATYIDHRSDAEHILGLIQREPITTMGCTPVLWQRMADSKLFAATDLSRLKAAFTGGAPVPSGLSKRYAERGVCIRQAYGLSEFSGVVTLPSEQCAIERPDVAGIPVQGASLRIVNESQRECNADEVGEIWVRGPQLMAGYWRNPTANAASMHAGWFKTGDLGRRNSEGQLSVLERKKNMIISGGVNIYPAELERALALLPDISEVAVFGVRDAEWGEKVIAVVYSTTELQAAELRARAKELLGPLKCPREFLVSDKPLPRTNLEKISRQSLPALYEALTGKTVSAIKASVTDEV